MKFTVDRNDLASAITFASQGRGTRSPLYSGILLQAGQDGLRLTGSDGYVSFESLVPGEYDSGEVLLPGLVASVVPALAGEEVSLVIESASVVITAGRSRFTLQTLPADGYPARPSGLPARGGVDAPDFARALRRVLPAVDTTGKTGIPALSGILVRQVHDRLEFLATDRFCLGQATCSFFPVDETSPDVILLGVIAPKLLKLEGELILEWNEQLFRVKTQDAVITTRALQGKFPAWKYPQATWLYVGPDFASVVKRAAAAGSNAITLTFGDNLLIESTGETGSFAETVPFEYNESLRLALSPVMLLDGLAGCGDDAEIGFTTAGKPVHLRDDGFTWSLQPRRET
jgi:DNA polymerase-3 subunit beta